MQVNWEAVGAIAEAVGAIGVIATLIHLSAQIRQNSDVVRSATRQAVSDAQREMGIELAKSAELRAAAARWHAGREDSAIADSDRRDDVFLRANLRMFENQYHQNRDGTFDDTMWSGYLANMRRIFSAPAFHEWWGANRSLYSTDFADFVEAEVRASRGTRREG